ncbi:MAG: AsmA family protein [Hyphomicrobium sp.]
MNNGLLYLGGLLALVLATLFGAPYFIDWNGYRGVFEEEASKVLGRDVRVGGAVNVRFLPTPFVRFEKVRLADTTGQTGEPFIRAESFTMRLAVSPLLRGAFEANEIELNKPVLSLVLDDAGGGNWSTLELRPAELPFVPQNVALHSVRLLKGAIAFHRADGALISTVDAINGELSADTLKGPFKFKGSARVGSVVRDIRFSTAPEDNEGVVHLKAAMYGDAGVNSYAFDGALRDFTTAPKVTGDLTGKIFLSPPATSDAQATREPPPVLNLKTATTANASGASFDNVELELDGAAEPQILTGAASANWANDLKFDTKLTAKWLDLDMLAAPHGQQAGIDGLRQLFMALVEGLGGNGSASVQVAIDQVKFGGEQAGALDLDAERHQDVVTLRRLSGGLPGGARIDLSGKIEGAKRDDKTFIGEGTVRGVNFARVQAFAKKSGIDIDLNSDGPFWVAGEVAMGPGRFALTNAKAQISGQLVDGEVRIDSGARKHVTVRLDGDDIDSAVFFPEQASYVSSVWRHALGLETASDKEAAENPEASRPETTVELTARRLTHAGSVYNDVDAQIVIEPASLNVPKARLKTQAGARISTSGRIMRASADGGAAKGTLNYEIDAADSRAIGEVSKLLGLEVILDKQITALPSARLAGLVQIGKRQAGSADVTFDGLVGGARLIGEGAFDNGFSAWRTAPARIVATINAADLGEILKLAGAGPQLLNGLKSRPGEVSLAVSGLLSQGAKSLAEVNAQGLSAKLQGLLSAQDNQTFAYEADGSVDAQDAREALVLAGVVAPAGLTLSSLAGPIKVSAKDGVTTLASRNLKSASSVIKGSVKLTRGESGSGEGVSNVEADLEADQASVAGLQSWLSEAARAEAAEDVEESVWPTAQFDLKPFAHNRGTMRLKLGKLELADGLEAQDAIAQITVEDSNVSIESLKARAAGGDLNLSAKIEKVSTGFTLSGNLALDADLAALNAKAKGRALLEFEGSGRGLSPATIINGLTGKGTIKLHDARHPGPAPALVADASDAVLAGQMENDANAIGQSLSSALASASVVEGDKTLSFEVAGGNVKVEPYTVKTAQGSAQVTTTASLSSLGLDSDWQVSAMATPLPPPPEAGPDWKPAFKGPLPAVEFVYTGALGDLDGLEVSVEAADLQRELAVRQMERKVEELEILRKNDDDRQRMDLERRKILEVERAKAAAAAAAAKEAAKQQQKREQQPSNASGPPVVPESSDTEPIVPQSGPPEDTVETTADVPAEVASEPRRPLPQRTYSAKPDVRSPPRARRTPSDEINRAFGNWP